MIYKVLQSFCFYSYEVIILSLKSIKNGFYFLPEENIMGYYIVVAISHKIKVFER